MWHDPSSFSSRILAVCLMSILSGLLVGCDSFLGFTGGDDGAPPEPYPLTVADSTTVEPGIEVTLRAPDTVALSDPFHAQVRIDNQNEDTVRVVTGTPALYDFGVFDGPERAPLEGTFTLLPQVETEQDLPPTELVREIQLRAARFSDEEAPIGPGTYTNRLVLNWDVDGTVVQDTLDTTIVFREE